MHMQDFHFAVVTVLFLVVVMVTTTRNRTVTVGYTHFKPFSLYRRLWAREGISSFAGYRVWRSRRCIIKPRGGHHMQEIGLRARRLEEEPRINDPDTRTAA